MAFFTKKDVKAVPEFESLPTHLGIIMDGNGRWAKKRGLPRSAGHKAGANVFRTISDECANLGIKYVTFYAFSTENWKRPKEEVDALMALFKDYKMIPLRARQSVKPKNEKKYMTQLAKVIALAACAPALSALAGLWNMIAAVVVLIASGGFFIW